MSIIHWEVQTIHRSMFCANKKHWSVKCNTIPTAMYPARDSTHLTRQNGGESTRRSVLLEVEERRMKMNGNYFVTMSLMTRNQSTTWSWSGMTLNDWERPAITLKTRKTPVRVRSDYKLRLNVWNDVNLSRWNGFHRLELDKPPIKPAC